MPDKNHHLKRRGNIWYVRVRTPAALHSQFGPEVVRTTKTADVREARRLRDEMLGEIRAEFRRALHGPVTAADRAVMLEAAQRKLLADARAVAELLKAELDDDSPKAVGARLELDAAVERVFAAIGGPLDEQGYPIDLPSGSARSIRAAYRIADGASVYLLNEEIEKYLAEIGSGEKPVTQQTLRIKRRILEAFAEFVGNVELHEITKRHAAAYLEQKLLPAGRSTKTTKDELAHLSAFFNHCEARGRVEYNPFRNLSRSVRNGTRGVAKEKRTEWTADEMRTLFGALDATDRAAPEVNAAGRMRRTPDLTLFSMAAIAAYSGLRENEIGELQAEDVHDDHIHVPEGKTESSVRDVPLHPVIRPLVRYLKENAGPDGYLIPYLTPGGDDGKRAWNFSKTFGRRRRQAGVDRKFADMHALRHSFITALKRAGVDRETREELAGHKGEGRVHDRYSHKHWLETLAKAVRKVSYGADVDRVVRSKADELMKRAGAAERIESRSRRRGVRR